jgi:hypothetical protein
VSGSPPWWERRPAPVREDRLAVFLRGLVLGAFFGAIIAGSAVLRRTLHR